MERVRGIEPPSSAWKAVALPLSYTRPGTRLLFTPRPRLRTFSPCPPSDGGGSRTRTYEGEASGFTVRPLCRSGHSPKSLLDCSSQTPASPGFARAQIGPLYARDDTACQSEKDHVERAG